MNKATLSLLSKHLNAHSRIVLRADLNVTIKDGNITDIEKIHSNISTHLDSLPTLR